MIWFALYLYALGGALFAITMTEDAWPLHTNPKALLTIALWPVSLPVIAVLRMLS